MTDLFETAKAITETYAEGMRQGAAITHNQDRKILEEILQICIEEEGEIRLKIAAKIKRHLEEGGADERERNHHS